MQYTRTLDTIVHLTVSLGTAFAFATDRCGLAALGTAAWVLYLYFALHFAMRASVAALHACELLEKAYLTKDRRA